MELSQQQAKAKDAVLKWHKQKDGQQVFRLFGYAGTGKTTLAKIIAAEIKGEVLYAAFTGKAALVLQSKGCGNASTVHSLIYKARQDERTGKYHFSFNWDSAVATASLLIVDEVSMVGEELAKDLLRYGTKILVLGDPAQLPPVKSEGYFINAEPDVMLTDIHRQAAENPIIRLSVMVREGRPLQPGNYGGSVIVKRENVDKAEMSERVLAADQILCGLNKTRVNFNKRVRQLLNREGEQMPWYPTVDDRLVCLKNNHDAGYLNGGLWIVEGVIGSSTSVGMQVKSLDVDDHFGIIDVPLEFFNGTEKTLDWRMLKNYDQFTYGYCLTVHKSQGSQWDNVLVFDESGSFVDSARNHLYTAITRAAETVTVIL